MTPTADPVGSLDVALAHAARLLENQPKLAAERAEEILRVPEQPDALLVTHVRALLDYCGLEFEPSCLRF